MTKKTNSLSRLKLAAALLLPLSFALGACDDGDGVRSYRLVVSYALPDGLAAANVGDVKLVVSNSQGYAARTLTSSSLDGDTLTLTQGSYQLLLTGKVTNEANGYVAAQTNVDVYQDQALALAVNRQTRSSLIFKEIYTTGGRTGYVRDQYFEIVNNSDEVQYLDGVMLVCTGNANTSEQNVWQANGYTDRYASAQGCVIAFPSSASGREIPLRPGASVVVATDAANHSDLAPSPNSCPDLSQAAWEVVLDYISDEVDYPARNMEVVFTNNTYMKAFGLGFFSGGYLLVRLPQGTTPAQFAADPANLATTPGTTSSMQFLIVPSAYVLDAVDMWDSGKTDHYLKFLATDDAAGVLAPTAWQGRCIRRRVASVENGRAVFADTNNSQSDFLTEQPLRPGHVYTEVDQ